MKTRPVYDISKRILDVSLSAAALVLLSPPLLLIAAIVRFESPGPVLFQQRRLGKGGRPFVLYKFRTMVSNAAEIRNADGSCSTSARDPRLTRIGAFLRESSIDELPQLVNVLRGEMSLVGPRPDLESQLPFYDDVLRRKLLVLPGLTSVPAVSGRNGLSWHQRAELDGWYVANRSLALDLSILFRTALVVIRRDGIYTPLEADRSRKESAG